MSKVGERDDPDWETRRPWIVGSSAGSWPIGPSHRMLHDAAVDIERAHGGRMPSWCREFTTFDINASMDLSNDARMTIYRLSQTTGKATTHSGDGNAAPNGDG